MRFFITASLAALLAAPLPSAHGATATDNALGIAFARLPAGQFSMGSDESVDALAAAYPALERSRFESLSDEAPVHVVRITKPFEMSRHERLELQFGVFGKAPLGVIPARLCEEFGEGVVQGLELSAVLPASPANPSVDFQTRPQEERQWAIQCPRYQFCRPPTNHVRLPGASVMRPFRTKSP